MAHAIYIANWKMFHSLETAEQWVAWWERHPLDGLPTGALIAVCPPAPLIYPLYAYTRQRRLGELLVGAQNLHGEFKGAYTGEVSGVALWSVGAECVIIGHSERRSLAHETDEMVGAKMEQAYVCGLCPILCVGESDEERSAGRTQEVLERQLSAAFATITPETVVHRQCGAHWPPFVIAYEPIWAIGSGRPATATLAEETLRLIRDWLAGRWATEIASDAAVLYGGSVTAANVGDYTATPSCDGVLVGGASLDPQGFQALVIAGLAGRGVAVAPQVGAGSYEH